MGPHLAPDSSLPQSATTSIDVAADPEVVWRVLTGESGLSQWMGAGSTIGADGALLLNDVATGRRRRGAVTAAVPGKSLRFVWWAEDEPEDVTAVTIELAPADIGTRVTVTESVAGRSNASVVNGVRSTAWGWRLAMVVIAAVVVAPAAA